MATEQTCVLLSSWIEAKYIIPALMVLLSSGLFPFLLHKYKVKREREEKLFDTRKTEYQAYFKNFEKAASLAQLDYEKYQQETFPTAYRKLLESSSSPEAIMEFQQTCNDFTKNINEGFQKATNEFTSLRIVCSNRLALLFDDFENTYKKMMSLQPQMLREIQESITVESFINGEFNFNTPTQKELTLHGERISKLRDDIIKMMRKDLGYTD